MTEAPGAGFQRLVGGGVEHGELSHEALARELGEELGHEVVFVREVRLLDGAADERDVLPRVDRDDDVAVWRSLSHPPDVPLYVEGWETLVRPPTAEA